MALAHKIILLSTGAPADMSTGSTFFIGTATVLIRYAGFTVLTDPNFIHMHEKVDLGYGLSATRQTNPALEIDELPPVDFVLLSHFHGDHFDQVAEREIEKSLPIVTTPEAAEALRQRGFVAPQGLTTWEDIYSRQRRCPPPHYGHSWSAWTTCRVLRLARGHGQYT